LAERTPCANSHLQFSIGGENGEIVFPPEEAMPRLSLDCGMKELPWKKLRSLERCQVVIRLHLLRATRDEDAFVSQVDVARD